MIATKTKPKRKAADKHARASTRINERFPAGGEAARAPDGQRPALVRARPESVEPADIDVAAIAASPYQPRSDFPAAEIKGLAESIQTHGQLQPVLVRYLAPGDSPRAAPGGSLKPVPRDSRGAKYELLDGERRRRAAKLLGLKTIRAEVIEATDDQAREIALVSAIERKQLSPIEEARGMAAILAAAGGPTQVELAKRLGCTQGHISNRVRLLALPDVLRQRIISGEIPASAALPLLVYKDHPELLAAVPAALDEMGRGGTRDAEAIEDALHEVFSSKARRLGGNVYDRATHRYLKCFTPTPAQKEQLAIVAGPNKGPYATNAALFDELQAAYAAKGAARAEKKAEGGRGKAEKKNGKPLSAAEQKREAADEARRRGEQQRQHNRRLVEWRTDWKRYLIARKIKHADDSDLFRLLMLSVTWTRNSMSAAEELYEVLGSSQKAIRNPWAAIAAMGAGASCDVQEVARKLLARCFDADYDGESAPNPLVDGDEVDAIAKYFAVDLKGEWLVEQAGPLSESFWALHTKQQLVALAAELKADFTPAELKGTKQELVRAFLARRPKEDDKEAGLPLPAEVPKAK